MPLAARAISLSKTLNQAVVGPKHAFTFRPERITNVVQGNLEFIGLPGDSWYIERNEATVAIRRAHADSNYISRTLNIPGDFGYLNSKTLGEGIVLLACLADRHNEDEDSFR